MKNFLYTICWCYIYGNNKIILCQNLQKYTTVVLKGKFFGRKCSLLLCLSKMRSFVFCMTNQAKRWIVDKTWHLDLKFFWEKLSLILFSYFEMPERSHYFFNYKWAKAINYILFLLFLLWINIIKYLLNDCKKQWS